MKSDKSFLMLASIFLLLAVDWLTFHDFFEPHTWRDWLTLLASIFIFIYFALDISKKKK
jgi:hypothetical protein